MKKLVSIIVMMSIMTLTGVTALAESPPVNPPERELKVTVPENVIALKEAIKEVNENIKSIHESMKEVRSSERENYKSLALEIKNKILTKRDSNKQLKEEYTVIKEDFLKLRTRLIQQVKEAKQANDTEKLEVLKAELSAAKTAFETVRNEIIPNKESFEEEKLDFQNLKAEYKALKDEISPYMEAIKGRHVEIVSLREEVKNAFSIKDFDTVTNLLSQILELKEANYSDFLTIQSFVQ